jgi:hypothetical protein
MPLGTRAARRAAFRLRLGEVPPYRYYPMTVGPRLPVIPLRLTDEPRVTLPREGRGLGDVPVSGHRVSQLVGATSSRSGSGDTSQVAV